MLHKGFSILLCLYIAISSGCSDNTIDVKDLEHRFGQSILSGLPQSSFDIGYESISFSESSLKPLLRKGVYADPLVLQAIDEAFSIYSVGSFNGISESIYVFDRVFLGNNQAGGFYGPGYIAFVAPVNMLGSKRNLVTMVGTIHHELSSHILMRNPVVAVFWSELLPANWQQVESAENALSFKSPYTFNDGFVTSYAATSLENDFNEVAAMTLSEPTRMRGLAGEHPIIAKKLYLLMSVYDEFDPKVKQFFDEQGLRDVAIPVESATVSFKAPEGLFDHLKPVISQ